MVIFHVSSIKLRKMAIIDISKSIFSVIWGRKKYSNTSSETANKMESDGVTDTLADIEQNCQKFAGRSGPTL